MQTEMDFVRQQQEHLQVLNAPLESPSENLRDAVCVLQTLIAFENRME